VKPPVEAPASRQQNPAGWSPKAEALEGAFQFQAAPLVTGSHQRIRPGSVLDMKTVIPSADLMRAFTGITKPMFDRIHRNTGQSRTPATLRDTLLPHLLSGELRVELVTGSK